MDGLKWPFLASATFMRVFHVSATTTSTRVGWRFSSSEPPRLALTTAAFSFDVAAPSKTNLLTRAL